MDNIKKENLIKVSGYKPGQRAINIDGKWIVVGIGGNVGTSTEKTDLSFITATDDKILEGYIGVDKDGNQVEGTIQQGLILYIGGDTVHIPKGYYPEAEDVRIWPGSVDIVGNNVTVSEGYVPSNKYIVGSSVFPEAPYVPTTSDFVINGDSYIVTDYTIKGDPNLTPENIANGVSIFDVVGTYKGNSSGVDVSGVTAEPYQVLNTAKYVKSNGELVSGTMQTVSMTVNGNTVYVMSPGYIESTSVQIPYGQYSIDGNEVRITVAGYFESQTIEVSGGSDLSFITAGANQILAGYVSVDNKGNQVSGTIVSRTENDVSTLGTVVVPEGFYPKPVAKNLTSSTVSVSGNVVTITTGWKNFEQVTVGRSLPGGMNITPSATADYVLHKDSFITNGNITLAKEPNYLAENIKEGVTMWGVTGTYKGEGGGSETGNMEIYKCAEGVENSKGNGYIVSNCGNAELNGTYAVESVDTQYIVYKNEQGATLYVYDDFSYSPPYFMKPNPDNSDLPEYQIPIWQAITWSTNGDVTSVTSWNNLGYGINPTPSISQLAGEPLWNGYLYNTETKEFSETMTEGLEYKMAAPVVGKIYNADATMLIDLYTPSGLVFYAPLHGDYKAVTNQNMQVHYQEPQKTVLDGIACYSFEGNASGNSNGYFYTDDTNNLPYGNSNRTVSCLCYTRDSFGCLLAYGKNTNTNIGSHFGLYVNDGYIRLSCWFPDYDYTDVDIKLNEWCHVSLSVEDNAISLYIDGNLAGTLSGSLNTLEDRELCIGGNVDQSQALNTATLNGSVTEVKVWNRALSVEEIKAEAGRCLAMVESDSSGSEDTSTLIVSGAGSTDANGTYIFNEENQIYYKDGDTSGYNIGQTPAGYYVLNSGGSAPEMLYKSEGEDVTAGWSVYGFGISPAPTVSFATPDSSYGTKLTVESSNLSSFAGAYTLNDSTTTGTDRVWNNDSNTGMTIAYHSDGWYLCNSGIKAVMIASGDNPWDGLVYPWTVTVVE